ncbi:MAG: SDR family NAD(P)-dependent oxidoreductase, partial [Bacteroidota bacterium]
MDNQKKRIVLVTGATGGLGTAMCKKLYDDGFRVVGNYRSKTKAEEWKSEMEKTGYKIDLFSGDVADFDSAGNMIKEIEAS